MKVLRSTSVTVAISTLLAMSGCSTSTHSVVPSQGATEYLMDAMPNQLEDTQPGVAQGSGELKLDADYPAMLEALAAYRLESLSEEVMLLADTGAMTAIASTSLESGSFDVLDRDETLKPALLRTSYACELGGEMIIENGSLILDEPEYTHRVSVNNYRFDQCRLVADGDQLFHGYLSVLDDYTSGRHFSVRSGQVQWQGFEWLQGSGLAVSGDATIDQYSFDSFDSQQYRNVGIRNFAMTYGNEIVELVVDGIFRQSAESSANGGIKDYSMSASGSVTNASGVAVQINSEPGVSSRVAAASLELASVFEGQVLMSGYDGSQLSLTATPSSESAVLQVDVQFQNSAGGSRTQLAQNFVELPFRAE